MIFSIVVVVVCDVSWVRFVETPSSSIDNGNKICKTEKFYFHFRGYVSRAMGDVNQEWDGNLRLFYLKWVNHKAAISIGC